MQKAGERWRSQLGDRLIEVKYEDLTVSPGKTLGALADFLGLQKSSVWLDDAAAEVQAGRHASDFSMVLPSAMAADFNELQRLHGYDGRAGSTGPSETTH